MAMFERPLDPTSLGYRAMLWGVITWLFNLAGVFVGQVPIAFPILILSTVATLITGAGAMAMGVKARVEAGEDRDEALLGVIGFWLGTSHLIIVCVITAIVLAIVYDVGGIQGLLGLRMAV
jgi:hypothetical protein